MAPRSRAERELVVAVEALASALRVRGIGQNDRVILVAKDGMECVGLFLAIQLLGAVPIFHDPNDARTTNMVLLHRVPLVIAVDLDPTQTRALADAAPSALIMSVEDVLDVDLDGETELLSASALAQLEVMLSE